MNELVGVCTSVRECKECVMQLFRISLSFSHDNVRHCIFASHTLIDLHFIENSLLL